ncbi:hypothetical protein Tco_0753001 [Tanacetum coccineum]
MSPGNVAREGIPFELFRSTYPGRHVAWEMYPQRQVARDTPDLSLGNIANVVNLVRNDLGLATAQFDLGLGREDNNSFEVYPALKKKTKVNYTTTGSRWFPVTEIQNDKDLSVFISETSKTRLPLCVSRSLAWDAQAEVDGERRKDNVTVFIAYDGKWEYDDDKERMIFKNSKSSTIFVPRCITLSEITDILYEHLDVDKKLYRLKLEVNHETERHRLSRIKIQSDFDLSEFISETSETKLLLCVTRIYDAISSDDAGERPKEEKGNIDIENNSLGGTDTADSSGEFGSNYGRQHCFMEVKRGGNSTKHEN